MVTSLERKFVLCCVAALIVFAGLSLAAAPKLIEMVPANGEDTVDPSLTTVRFVFDQDMTTGRHYSICGGGDAYPGGQGSPQWVDSRTLEWTVELRPNHEYRFSINCPSSHKGFRNTNGEPADYTSLKFTTGSKTEGASDMANTASVASLFQQALYAEKTEGDLEKAIGLYEQVIDQAADVQRVAARALLQLAGCYEKKGDTKTAAKYYQQIIEVCPSQKSAVSKASEKLAQIRPQQDIADAYTLPKAVWNYIGNEFVANYMEATQKDIAANTHVYGVSNDMQLTSGGILMYRNNTTSTINPDQEIQTGRFSYNNLTIVDQYGKVLNSRMEADPLDSSKYRLFWKPDAPIAPGQMVGIGWQKPGEKELIKNTDGSYSFDMQNFYGSKVLESFFLVLPCDLEIKNTSESFYSKQEFGDLTVYTWKKEVPENTNHKVTVKLKEKAKTTTDVFIPDASYMRDNEFMKFSITHPNGMSIGTLLWRTKLDGGEKNIWDIESYMLITAGTSPMQQYTFVAADAQTLKPTKAVTDNWSGKFEITYNNGSVNSKITNAGNTIEKNIDVAQTVFDNEEAFYVIRSMPLFQGFEKSFMIYPPQSGIVTECKIKVDGIENITFDGKETDCYKTKLSCSTAGQTVLEHTLWITTDPLHWIVKYDSGVAIMNLAEYGIKDLGDDKEKIFETIGEVPATAETSEIDMNKKATIQEKKQAEDLRASGWRFFMQGKQAEAEEEFKKALSLDPQMENGWQGLGWAQKAQNKNLNAKDSFEKCLAINPKNSAALNGMGQIAKEQGDIEKAEEYWKRGVAADSNATGPMLGLAKLYEEKEEYREAAKYYKMWLKVEPNNQTAKDGLEKMMDKLRE